MEAHGDAGLKMGLLSRLRGRYLSAYRQPARKLRLRKPFQLSEALAALRSSELRDRFYSWRGGSGRRYVCSVFPAADQAVIAESWSAAVIGVVNDSGARRPVYVVSCDEFRALTQSDACAQGVNEWHVHFGADAAELRDLSGSADS